MRFLLTGLLLAAFALPVAAQDAPAMISDPLVVKAANRERTLSYVRAATQLSDGRISRRGPDLCPIVAGAGKDIDTYVRSRLHEVARDVGLRFESRKCYPNLLILFSRDPEAMLDQARRRGKVRYEAISAPRLERFKAETRPVRWLNTTGEIPAFGDLPPGDAVSGGDTAVRNVRAVDSHIIQPVASRLHYGLVVVDARKADGIEVAALADYLSMVALADIRPDARLDQASILNLFVEPGGSKRMTASDRAYLRAVYKLKTDRVAQDQLGVLASGMAKELER